MTRNFHRWEVDPFFTAAEEVQDSADRLELAYRTWVHAKTVDVDKTATLEHCRRELSTALGTAKWQLEEFEGAVAYLDDDEGGAADDTPARHQQFVHALRSQVDSIEKALMSSGDSRDSKVLPVMRLGQEDKDDLTLFLCGSNAMLREESKKRALHRDEEITSESAKSSNEVSECFSTSASNSEKAWGKADSKSSNFFCRPVEMEYVDKCNKHTLSSEVCNLQNRESLSETSTCVHPSGCERSSRVSNGHIVSGSSGSNFGFRKSGSAYGDRSKGRSMKDSTIAALLKKLGVFHKKRSKSGLKRCIDGDANSTEDHFIILKSMYDNTDLEKGDDSTYLGKTSNCWTSRAPTGVCGTILCSKHWHDVIKMLLYYMLAFLRSGFVHKVSAILVASGFVGLIFFLATSSAP